jgi:hypothetical protein
MVGLSVRTVQMLPVSRVLRWLVHDAKTVKIALGWRGKIYICFRLANAVTRLDSNSIHNDDDDLMNIQVASRLAFYAYARNGAIHTSVSLRPKSAECLGSLHSCSLSVFITPAKKGLS